MAILALLLGATSGITVDDSSAEAGVLKNSVRAGDRSGMNISRPPRAGTRKRINVPALRKAAPAVRQRKQKRSAQYTWFWQDHDPKATADAGRWDAGLATLRLRHDLGHKIHSQDRVAQIAAQWRAEITAASRKHGVSELLLLGVMTAESLGKAKAKSHKGAQGLMQLIPATAARFGVSDVYDPGQNILGGAAYLAYLLKLFDEDPVLALAGYNAGENAVKKHGGVPPFTETRDYVAKVFDAMASAEALCLVRPSGPRQNCVWRATTDG